MGEGLRQALLFGEPDFLIAVSLWLTCSGKELDAVMMVLKLRVRSFPARAEGSAGLDPLPGSTMRSLLQTRQDNNRVMPSCIVCASEILLKRNALNTAPAEEEFLAAIAIAPRQWKILPGEPMTASSDFDFMKVCCKLDWSRGLKKNCRAPHMRGNGGLVRRIEEWLGDLELGEYASRFVENDIDLSIVRDLSDQDLKEPWVVSLGHRRKPLRAISLLNASLAQTVSTMKVPTWKDALLQQKRSTCPMWDVTGERRYLTVLFCDLVDSTGIAARLDAKEWRDLVGAYFEGASAAVTEMGGIVAKRLGDGRA